MSEAQASPTPNIDDPIEQPVKCVIKAGQLTNPVNNQYPDFPDGLPICIDCVRSATIQLPQTRKPWLKTTQDPPKVVKTIERNTARPKDITRKIPKALIIEIQLN